MSVSFALTGDGADDDDHDMDCGNIDDSNLSKGSRLSTKGKNSARGNNASRTIRSSVVLAYESVLRGMLDSLVAEEVVDVGGSQQLVALAEAHNEPSFAALAAAKALLGGHIERFVAKIQATVATAANSTTALDHDANMSMSSHLEYSSFYG